MISQHVLISYDCENMAEDTYAGGTHTQADCFANLRTIPAAVADKPALPVTVTTDRLHCTTGGCNWLCKSCV